MLSQASMTYINTLRASGRAGNDGALRARLESALGATTFQPASLPHSAIACIRRMSDPLPGALPPRHGAIRPSMEWEQALHATIDRLVREAARPIRGMVPAAAEAVVFADRAELLACLAADWCEGRVATQWWWQALFRRQGAAQAVLQEWRTAPEYVPAALQHLSERGLAAPFARVLSDGDARVILHGVLARFGLHDLRAALDGATAAEAADHHSMPDSKEAGPRWSARSPHIASDSASHRVREVDEGTAAPWLHQVPESAAGNVGIEQHCLLGIGLMVRRAPLEARAPLFANAVRRWLYRAMAVRTDTPAAANDTRGHSDKSDTSGDPPVSSRTRSDTSATITEFTASDTDNSTPRSQAVKTSPLPAHDSVQMPDAARVMDVRDNVHLDTVEKVQSSAPASREDNHADARPESDVLDVADLIAEEIETALGGVFYLINLGLALDLYGDFTTPAQPGIPLPLWDFVALLGRWLVGPAIEHDPIWALLARLAGRDEREEPGSSFAPPDRWRLPAEWLAPFGQSGVWRWSATGGRLRVAHPAGFQVIDLPLDASHPSRQARHEACAYGDEVVVVPRRGRRRGAAPASPLERWGTWLMPYVRARLCRALGLPSRSNPARLLCAHRARVAVTATHLDVTLRLADLPVAIRIAGLDRNPGWVPAAGRYITFYFD